MCPTIAPRVSILLPAYDAAATLPACLRSIARQTFADWECVLIDDGSRDATGRIAEAFAADDRRLRVIHRDHRGLVAALNDGLARCRGRYVARMDADDLMHSHRLHEQVALLDDEAGLAGVGCHVRLFPRAVVPQGSRDYEAWLNSIDSPARLEREAWIECPLAHPTLLLRREQIPGEGYRDRGWPEDYDLVLRLLCDGRRLGVLTRRRLAWREHPDRLWRSDPAYSRDAFTRCKAEFLARSFLAGVPDYVLWGHGATGRAIRRALAAHDRHPSHVIEVHPRRLGNVIGGAPVIPPEGLVALRGARIVVSVVGPGPRSEIRSALQRMGRAELRDFVCVA